VANEIIVHRSGVLQSSQLVETRGTSRSEVPPELIIEFCRSLIRNTMSPDLIWLSAHAAKFRTGSTDLDMNRLISLIQELKEG
jgi:hypothetical protein